MVTIWKDPSLKLENHFLVIKTCAFYPFLKLENQTVWNPSNMKIKGSLIEYVYFIIKNYLFIKRNKSTKKDEILLKYYTGTNNIEILIRKSF